MIMERKHYGAIDGLRMIAAFGIVMMHVRANSTNVNAVSGFVYDTMIPSFTNFVFLFMVISAFGMCCGYYEKILNNTISMTEFYKKRFLKVLPFFAVLVLLDVVLDHSLASLYEGFADMTLMFGLLPDCGNITVIGVGWFLGLTFVFYLIFPFFCVMIETKRRAWIAFFVSILYNYIGSVYFNISRTNILYSGCFFIAGGLIYLYREQIAKISVYYMAIVSVAMIVMYYVMDENVYVCMLMSGALLMYALLRNGGLLDNRITGFFSGISMEIYLSHMVIFRVLEKIGVTAALGNGWLQYIVTVILVLAGASVFAVVMKNIIKCLSNKLITEAK